MIVCGGSSRGRSNKIERDLSLTKLIMEENISIILDLFPSLSVESVKSALQTHNDNVEDTINHLLTNNGSVDSCASENNNGTGGAGETEEQINERLLMAMLKAEQEEQEKVNRSKKHYCSICLDDLEIDKFYIVDECEHRFCTECIIAHAKQQLYMGYPDIKCPHTTCKRIISYEEVKHFLDAQTFASYDQQLLLQHLKKDDNCKQCPSCHVAMVVSTVKIDEHMEFNNENLVGCPNCNYAFCIKCRDHSHYDFSCEQWEDVKDYVLSRTEQQNQFQINEVENYVSFQNHRQHNRFWNGGRKWRSEHHNTDMIKGRRKKLTAMQGYNVKWQVAYKRDKLIKQWIQNNTKTCPHCFVIIQKDGGCNDMTCVCGNHFCYSCEQTKDFHFKNKMRYPCPGGFY
ncbi:hypothetical protein PPL_06010 [Heterostelium album PN500]|uniref:RBR-type E3 ubiquitin transferase n=1 Tax=Heterostelium pallidum (strain ATCC 26659 / Pp 5 / PN500) TaxID=670386 RepID=D3BBZ0_HETP5|nr:hypothetical protein PPL_06010 [Heterostelium album PN500]EFA81173.1 hypothetical protein PPL_06010 [Heterostelium album PN500]|eukprot:XP_020433291.1 hypothetical protein PPL_06010 [Heterostelium album PN500]